jgi:mono/diheme cytochrome c family protein
VLAGAVAVRAADGPAVFAAPCAPCHGLDGKARTPAGKKLGAKDLSESKMADDAIVHPIGEGLKDQKGTERMPSCKARLAKEEIAALVAVVKAFRR